MVGMHNTHHHISAADVLAALHEALGNAVDNLADVTQDPELLMQCAADVAALRHLTLPDATGNATVAAYL